MVEAPWPLLVHLAVFAANTLVYVAVGRVVLQWSPSTRDAKIARAMFAVWWFALAVAGATQAIQVAAALAGLDSPALYAAFLLVSIAALSAGLCGLVHYLVFLFTGRSRAFVPLVAAYAAFYVLVLYYVASGGPAGHLATRWHVELTYATPPPAPFRAALFAFLSLPQLGGAIAYAALLRSTRDPEARYRIGLVSTGIVVWTITTLLQGYRLDESNDALQLSVRLVGFGAVLLLLAAYRPPAWARARLKASSA